jgi:threonine aldolase
LIALQSAIDRLAEDHVRAARIAEAAAERWPASGLDPAAVSTNIVIVKVPCPAQVVEHLHGHGVLVRSVAPGIVRFVTHRDVDDRGIEQALWAINRAPA